MSFTDGGSFAKDLSDLQCQRGSIDVRSVRTNSWTRSFVRSLVDLQNSRTCSASRTVGLEKNSITGREKNSIVLLVLASPLRRPKHSSTWKTREDSEQDYLKRFIKLELFNYCY